MKKRSTQLFVLAAFLIASMFSVAYLATASSSMIEAPTVFQYEEIEQEEKKASYLPDVAVVQALLGTAQRFFGTHE